jgi:hypothetical protein
VTGARRAGRGLSRDLDAGPFQPMIDSFELFLLAGRKSSKRASDPWPILSVRGGRSFYS